MIKFGIGMSNFRKMRDDSRTYVDKTHFIENFIKDYSEVSLFTRPRRFGKTLMLSMLSEFFDITKKSKNLFKYLKIIRNEEVCEKWMNKYPVVKITFKDINTSDYSSSIKMFSDAVYMSLNDNLYLLNSKSIHKRDKIILEHLYNGLLDDQDLCIALKSLCSALESHWKKEIILLIDEYDVPINTAYHKGYYEKMIDFMQAVLSTTLKDNPILKFAIITGCLRIARESIFTGVNNFKCFSISNSAHAEAFGFTDCEVDYLLEKTHLKWKKQEIKTWYDGYRFGEDTNIYCPWDVLNYIADLNANTSAKPEAYWINTSANDIIKHFIDRDDLDVQDKIETLVNGGIIKIHLQENITYTTLYDEADHFWSILYATGYLTKVHNVSLIADSEDIATDFVFLQIPNLEIREIFIREVRNCFRRKVQISDRTTFFLAFWNREGEAVSAFITDLLLSSISYHDYHENFYHAVLVGLFSGVGYRVHSNLESGCGRADILIKDTKNRRAACIEVKCEYTNQNNLEKKANDALAQIDDMRYDSTLLAEGFTVNRWGMAFFKKTCLAKCQS